MIVLADAGMSLPAWLYATLPFWPLLGSVLVGLLLVARWPVGRAHGPVVGGVTVSAILGVVLFFDLTNGSNEPRAVAPDGGSSATARENHQVTGWKPVPQEEQVGGWKPVPQEEQVGGWKPVTQEQVQVTGWKPVPQEQGQETGWKPVTQEQVQVTGWKPVPQEQGQETGWKPVTQEQVQVTGWKPVPQEGHERADRPFRDPGETILVYQWISLGAEYGALGQWISAGFYVDRLTGLMLLFVTVVSLMVVIYSIGYMRDHHGHPERGYERFFAFLGLFVFSMCMLVLAGNFVLLYLGWELVGLCSYLLIGFYYPRPQAAAAAKKAFLVNRVGDFGFALGIFALFMFLRGHVQPGESPLDYAVVFKYAGQLTEDQLTLVSLLLLCGAIGKSAQFPLHVWLPDAMEGPTPVSALIHAATMVTAGVYLVARCGPLFAASPTALTVVVWVGAIGAVLAATTALAQYDMKRILAYSTISQLAFMFVALGCGASDSGVFHVFTHAFFKALLFLCAGSVMHAMGGVIDLRQFSGLRQVLPQTQKLMLVGCLALGGFPLLSGFWSKDEIVHAAWEWHPLLGLILTATAGITAYYTFRMYFLCFHGPLRLPAEAGSHPHESPPVMLRPLYFLAFGAIFAGYVGVTLKASPGESFLGLLKPHGFVHDYLHESTMVSHVPGAGGLWIMYLSAMVAISGIGLAYVRYGSAPQVDPDAVSLGELWKLWSAKYWVDEIYDTAFVRPLRALADFLEGIDRNGIDGLVWFVSAVPRGAGMALRFLQQGALQGYALSMTVGVTLLLLIWGWVHTAAAG